MARTRLRLGLCVGINRYEGAPLYGCVNDALDWQDEVSRRHGYVAVLLADAQATRDAILGTLDGMVGTARFGDRIAFTFSGHGTYTADTNGDEADRRDEALVPFDYRQSGLILDDDLYEIFSRVRFGVRVFVFLDSCHSGTATRSLGAMVIPDARPKYLPPLEWAEPREFTAALKVEKASDGRILSRTGPIAISGAEDHEYSYDATFDGRGNGAATYHALRTLPGAASYAAWHRRLRERLPDRERGFEQSPVLTAKPWQRYVRPLA